MTRKLGKRQQERANALFCSAVNAELKGLGGKPSGLPFREWTFETQAGVMTAGPIASSLGHGGFVACRFEDVDRAVAFFGKFDADLNRYSGKWNLNLYDEMTTLDYQNRVRQWINRVLPTHGF